MTSSLLTCDLKPFSLLRRELEREVDVLETRWANRCADRLSSLRDRAPQGLDHPASILFAESEK